VRAAFGEALRLGFFMGRQDSAAFDLPGTGGYRAPSHPSKDA
jgi:hypothetical protein